MINLKIKISTSLLCIGLICPFSAFSKPKPKNEPDRSMIWRKGTPQQIEAAIKAGADINAFDKNAKTPLMWAAGDNPNPNAVAALLKAGADVNRIYGYHGTALSWAAQTGSSPEVIELLVKAGAPIEGPEGPGGRTTPLITAAYANSNVKIIKALLDAGANINASGTNSSTPLSSAIDKNPNPEIIKLLLARGAKMSGEGSENEPLIYAINQRVSAEKIRAIVTAGSNINKLTTGLNPTTAFILGCEHYDNDATIKTLIELGSDTNITDKTGATGLFYYFSKDANKRSLETIKFIIQKGADVNIGLMTGKAPISAIQNIEDLKLLLDLGANPNVIDFNGDTLISRITSFGWTVDDKIYLERKIPQMIKMAIDHGAKIDFDSNLLKNINTTVKQNELIRYTEKTDITPISVFYNANRDDLVEYLLKLGAKPTESDLVNIVQMYTDTGRLRVFKNQPRIMKLFLDSTSNIDISGNFGLKLFEIIYRQVNHYGTKPVFENAHHALAEELLKRSPNMTLVSSDGNTALSYALMFDKPSYTIIKQMINLGSDVNNRNKEGLSIRDLASRKDSKILTLVIQSGAKP